MKINNDGSIRMEELHHISSVSLPVLYKRNSSGKLQRWNVVVSEDSFYTCEGLVGGKLTSSKPTLCEGKNIGKSNETTPEQQAIAEAKAKFEKKLKSGYSAKIDEIEDIFKPMLAEKFDEGSEGEIDCYSQPKLDGLRCNIKSDSNKAMSRNGNEIVSIPHITEQIKKLGYNDLIFDGEIYNHDLKFNFNKIISLARKAKPTAEDLEESKELIQYHIYDCYATEYTDVPFCERLNMLTLMEKRINELGLFSLKIVETTHITSREQLDVVYEKYLEDGYEGQMVRFDKKYEQKRSKSLLKRKKFMTEEFELLAIEEGRGNRSGMAGYAHIRLADGRVCKTNIKGNFEFLTNLLRNADVVTGKMGTIKFFNYTPDGFPRFPYLIEIRDYE